MFASLAAARKKKTGKKSSGKKKKSAKRTTPKKIAEKQRAEAYQRGVNAIINVLLFVLILGAGVWTWFFLGKPGWPVKPVEDRSACLELYFYDSAVIYLVPVHRRVIIAPSDSFTRCAVREFAIGPNDSELARVYPANIPIPGVRVEGDTAIVDLPEEILGHLGGTSKERALLDALTLTVAAAGECNNVRILIAGEQYEATGEGYPLDELLEPPEFINHVPDSSIEGESQWVTAWFLRDMMGKYLFPLTLEIPADQPAAEAAVKALLDTPPRAVDPPPLRIAPPGHNLERLTIENSIAHVDIGVPNPQTSFLNYDINLFRRALYLTLKKCCDVIDVEISLNGRPIKSYGRFEYLPPLSDDNCWNLEADRSLYSDWQELVTPLEGSE